MVDKLSIEASKMDVEVLNVHHLACIYVKLLMDIIRTVWAIVNLLLVR